MRYALQSQAQWLLPDTRTAHCLRYRSNSALPVDVYGHATLGARFGNLQTCGSVWTCPVCSARICELRRLELGEALKLWPGSVCMLSFTLQHAREDSAKLVLQRLLDAHHRFWRYRFGRVIAKEWGVMGRVRALEVTYGLNGWHCHVHDLVFLKDKPDLELFEKVVLTFWIHVLSKVGAWANDHGLKATLAREEIADYVNKLGLPGLTHEFTSGKLGRLENLTPQQILYKSMLGNTRADEVFREYARTFKGRRRLVWSDGLKKLFHIPEVDDGLIAQEEVTTWDSWFLLAQLSRESWREVLLSGARATVLMAAKEGNWRKLREVLIEIGADRGNTYYELEGLHWRP
jgi:hypothetical protein